MGSNKSEVFIVKTTLKDIVYSFIQSIDLFNFLLKNHHRRVAVIAGYIGKVYGLSDEEMSRLVLSAALHDIGALSVEERDQLVHIDIENPHPHAKLGSYMLDSFEPFKELSKVIFYHHWSYMDHDKYIEDIGVVPIESYIIHLADRIDILIDQNRPILDQVDQIVNEILVRKNTLFHPIICDVFSKISLDKNFWLAIDNKSMHDILTEVSHSSLNLDLNLNLLEDFAFTVSKIIDCRSKFTVSHSFGVSAAAYEIAVCSGKDEEICRKLRVAGLLHDIGKLGVDVALIEKNGPLSNEERTHVESHAHFTRVILGETSGFSDIVNWASHHHENHMGVGYPDRYQDGDITEEMDILAYADILTALLEDRPYRGGMSIEKAMRILNEEFKEKHGAKILSVIEKNRESIYGTCKEAIRDGETRYDIYQMLATKYTEEFERITVH